MLISLFYSLILLLRIFQKLTRTLLPKKVVGYYSLYTVLTTFYLVEMVLWFPCISASLSVGTFSLNCGWYISCQPQKVHVECDKYNGSVTASPYYFTLFSARWAVHSCIWNSHSTNGGPTVCWKQ